MRFKLLQRIGAKRKSDPKTLREELFKLKIEKREGYIDKISKTDNGYEKITALHEHLETYQKTIEQTLYTIKKHFIAPTLTEIYSFKEAEAINWPETINAEKLVAKLPSLPEVEFKAGTNPKQVETLRDTFKAQVEQIDQLNLELRHIAHTLKIIENIRPSLSNANDKLESTVSLH